MIKYYLYCAECDDLYAMSIFKIDTEKDLYLECIEDDPDFTVGSVQVQEMLKNDPDLYGRPSEGNYYEDSLYDTLEEAQKARNDLFEECMECMQDD